MITIASDWIDHTRIERRMEMCPHYIGPNRITNPYLYCMVQVIQSIYFQLNRLTDINDINATSKLKINISIEKEQFNFRAVAYIELEAD